MRHQAVGVEKASSLVGKARPCILRASILTEDTGCAAVPQNGVESAGRHTSTPYTHTDTQRFRKGNYLSFRGGV